VHAVALDQLGQTSAPRGGDDGKNRRKYLRMSWDFIVFFMNLKKRRTIFVGEVMIIVILVILII
jgi:hypothetical protein